MDYQGIQETTPAFNAIDLGVIAHLTTNKLYSLKHDVNIDKLELSTFS